MYRENLAGFLIQQDLGCQNCALLCVCVFLSSTLGIKARVSPVTHTHFDLLFCTRIFFEILQNPASKCGKRCGVPPWRPVCLAGGGAGGGHRGGDGRGQLPGRRGQQPPPAACPPVPGPGLHRERHPGMPGGEARIGYFALG